MLTVQGILFVAKGNSIHWNKLLCAPILAGVDDTAVRERDLGPSPARAIRAGNVKLKRAYQPPDRADGLRVLVDRLWPRGISKAEAQLDQWAKSLAPSAELRRWFGHDPSRWGEFRRRYRAELRDHSATLADLRKLARNGPLTLVYSARDEAHNDAVVLRSVLLGRPNP